MNEVKRIPSSVAKDALRSLSIATSVSIYGINCCLNVRMDYCKLENGQLGVYQP